MKAVVTTAYGPPEVLQLQELPDPKPRRDEVLIRIRATTVSAGDCEGRRADWPLPLVIPLRLFIGITRPRRGRNVLGQELAGEVVEVGNDIEGYAVGDRVFAATGMKLSAYAQYVTLPVKHGLAPMPANMSYEEAACVPVGGLNALHFLTKADIRPGQKVLIYGSTGSIGTFAVQLARIMGAEVTAVCGPHDHELVKSLGASHGIDYTSEDFTDNGEVYDVVFDTIGKSPFFPSLRSVRKGGYYLQANPSLRNAIPALGTAGPKVVMEPAGYPTERLLRLKDLIEAGELRTVIDRRYPLEQIVEAHRYVDSGHKKGHVVITVP